MHRHFTKIAEKDGAALYEFQFQFGRNFLMMEDFSLKVAVKDGRAQPNLSDKNGLYWTEKETSLEDFNKNFEDYLARLEGK